MNRLLATLALPGLLLAGTGPAAAHGGQYRGPGDVVPPNPGGNPTGPGQPGNPTPPGPVPPAPPRPAPPTTGPPPGNTPAPPTGGPTPLPQRGPATTIPLGPDLAEWTFWWEFNKEPFLRLKQALGQADDATGLGGGLIDRLAGNKRPRSQPLKPSVAQLRDLVTPALMRALEEAENRDIVSSCLVALAKINRADDLHRVFTRYLPRKDQEISETAVLAFGIAQDEKSVPDLLEIFRDSARGQELVGDSPRVNFRKRAFAGYALGLIAHAHKDARLKRTVYEAAKEVMEKAGKFANRDIPVAAIQAIRILNPDLADPEEAKLALAASRYLLDYLKDEGNRFQVRAHVPTALARLLGRDLGKAAAPKGDDLAPGLEAQTAALQAEALGTFQAVIKERRENVMVLQSCVLALGQMGNHQDEGLVRLLEETAAGNLDRDLQVRFFAYIALGTLGGPGIRAELVSNLLKPGKNRDKPWIALGLGIEAATRSQEAAEPDRMVGEALLKAFERATNPEWKAGIAVALGLARCQEAGPALLQAIADNREADLRGYCAVGLGLMRYRQATGELRDLLDRSLRQPELLKQVAIGLGLMGDRNVVKSLLAVLKETKTVAATSAAASGLGFIGDTRAIDPLVDLLFNRDQAELSRAFAAVALGIIGDKEELPWNAKIGAGLNYRASVETLTGSASGVLDLL